MSIKVTFKDSNESITIPNGKVPEADSDGELRIISGEHKTLAVFARGTWGHAEVTEVDVDFTIHLKGCELSMESLVHLAEDAKLLRSGRKLA